MAQLASSFEEYGQWRDTLAGAIAQLRQGCRRQMLEPTGAPYRRRDRPFG
jgi:hypothetical protein